MSHVEPSVTTGTSPPTDPIDELRKAAVRAVDDGDEYQSTLLLEALDAIDEAARTTGISLRTAALIGQLAQDAHEDGLACVGCYRHAALAALGNGDTAAAAVLAQLATAAATEAIGFELWSAADARRPAVEPVRLDA